jgi:hypothetical protein
MDEICVQEKMRNLSLWVDTMVALCGVVFFKLVAMAKLATERDTEREARERDCFNNNNNLMLVWLTASS